MHPSVTRLALGKKKNNRKKKGPPRNYPFHPRTQPQLSRAHHGKGTTPSPSSKPTNTPMHPSDQPPPPPTTTAMATMRDGTTPRTSIANLILPPADISAENLLSLSNLAASMAPAAPSDRRRNFNRTKSTPAIRKHHHLPSEHLPDDTRRNHRMSRTTSVAAPLGVAHTSTKRLSRRGSGLALSNAARNAIVSSTSGIVSADSSSDPPGTPRARIPVSAPAQASAPSPAVLRPIHSNPITGYSKQTSQTNSVESCVPPASPIKSEAYHTAAARFQAGFAANALASMRADPMECDDAEHREPSSSSHDAKLAPRSGRSRTTPDAKRAQNRESAKRFRVAQKKRWVELQNTVGAKDKEIEKLKCMLQEVTNNTLAKRDDENRVSVGDGLPGGGDDPLGAAELSLFVKLMMSPKEEQRTEKPGKPAVPLAANIGALYRVLVCKVDGCVLGIRHHTDSGIRAMGGDVGALVWDHVEPIGVPHLRFSIVHAPHMEKFTQNEPQVLAYRRRQGAEREQHAWVRMKGCVYPAKNQDGHVVAVLLAEFIEL